MPRATRASATPTPRDERPTRRAKTASGSKVDGEGHSAQPAVLPLNGAHNDATNGASQANQLGQLDLETTAEVPYLDIYNSLVMPWFMDGVRQLQADNHSYPARSHAKDCQLTAIHRQHPPLAFGFDDDDGVVAYEMVDYESAGLWSDEQGEIALVVKPEFEDGQNDMLLLYKSNQVETVADVEQACQWAVVSDRAKKNKPTKRKSTGATKSAGKKKRKS